MLKFKDINVATAAKVRFIISLAVWTKQWSCGTPRRAVLQAFGVLGRMRNEGIAPDEERPLGQTVS